MEASTPLNFLYIQTTTGDQQAGKFQKLRKFVIQHHIQHVGIGLIDPQSHEGKVICGVDKNSLLVKHFLLQLPHKVKVSAHPYDGFANQKWPFRYGTSTGLNAVVRYARDMNNLLKSLHSPVFLSGLVFGESMGGKPYQNTKETVNIFKAALKSVELGHFTLGASPGGPNLGLDESYFQCYDWTPYDSKNRNYWTIHKNHPKQFFTAVYHAHSGWNGDQHNQIPWSETKNYYKANQKKWKWQIPEKGTVGKHFMWALNVPEGDHLRLSSWSPQGMIQFFRYVKREMDHGHTGFKTALYLDEGLKYFT